MHPASHGAAVTRRGVQCCGNVGFTANYLDGLSIWRCSEVAETGSTLEQKSHLQRIVRSGLFQNEKPLPVFGCDSFPQDLMAHHGCS